MSNLFDKAIKSAIPISAISSWRNLLGLDTDSNKLATEQELFNIYALCPWIYRAVEIRQNAITNVPLGLYKIGGSDDLSSQPSYDTLMRQVSDLLGLFEASTCLYGASYAIIEKNQFGRNPTPRWLSPSTLQVFYDELTGIKYVHRQLQTISMNIELDQLLYVWLPNYSSELGPGIAPAQAAFRNAKILINQDKYLDRYFDNGAVRPTLLLYAGNVAGAEKNPRSNPELTLIQRIWNRLVKGSDLSNVLPDNITPHAVGDPAKDTTSKEIVENQRESVGTGFGIPHSIMMSNAANYATSQQDWYNLYDQTIVPAARRHIAAFNAMWLAPLGLELRIEPQRLEAYQYVQLQTATAINSLVEEPILDVNEGREMIGYEPRPEKEPEATRKDILGYHIETGVASKNEARADVGLPPVDETQDQKLRQVKSQLDLLIQAKAAGLDTNAVALYIGLDPSFIAKPEPMPAPTEPTQPAAGQPEPTPEQAAVKALQMQTHSGAMIALFVPMDIAQAIALPDGVPAAELHLTLAYLGKAAELSPETIGKLNNALAIMRGRGVVQGRISGLGLFNKIQTDGTQALYASFDSPELVEFREELLDILETAGLELPEEHGFTPHITLGYVAAGSELPALALPELPVTFEALTLAIGGQYTTVALDRGQLKLIDLERWQRKAIKAVKRGKTASVAFESEHISADDRAELEQLLAVCADVPSVKAAFATALKARALPLTPEEQALADKIKAVFDKVKPSIVRSIANGTTQIDLTILEQLLLAELLPTMTNTTLAAMLSLASSIGVEFGVGDELAKIVDYANKYTVGRVKGMVETTRTFLQRAITMFVNSERGMTRENVEKLIAPVFGVERASTIAVTEITRASNQATLQYQEYLSTTYDMQLVRVWQTNNDELVCPICGALNEQLESVWSDKYPNGAPAHPNCRCSTTLTLLDENGKARL